VVTGGVVLSHTPAKHGVILPGEQSNGKPPTVALDNFSPLSNRTPSRAEPDSECNPSSQAPLIVIDNSRSTRNEETGYNPKGSIEKKNTVEQRRNATLDERDRSRPGGRTAHCAPGPNIVHPSVNRREQPHNPIQRINSGSPHAHNADQTHKYLPEVLSITESPLAHPSAPLPSASWSPPNRDHNLFSSSDLATPALTAVRSGYYYLPLSNSQPTVSIQPSPQPPPCTTIVQHKPPNAESARTQIQRRWSLKVQCDCCD
jgi:hypothetical protein